MPTSKLPPGVPARWPLAVTAPWLRRPGRYHLVVCARRPFVRTFQTEDLAATYATGRGADWITTVHIDSTRRTQPPPVSVDWNSQQPVSGYPGRCLVCERAYPAGTDIVTVTDATRPPGQREGWAHSTCAKEAENRG